MKKTLAVFIVGVVLAGTLVRAAESPAQSSVPEGKTSSPVMRLPEPIYPEALAARSLDLPGSFDIVDIRPAWQYEEYHIAGAVNLPLDQLLNDPARLSDKRPIVIVCRDGSLSAVAAGIFSQKTERPILYLHGGVRRYYDEIQRPAGIIGDTPAFAPDAVPPGAPSAPPGAADRPAGTRPAREGVKKPSAGC